MIVPISGHIGLQIPNMAGISNKFVVSLETLPKILLISGMGWVRGADIIVPVKIKQIMKH